jgi:diguanylate cyclase (GGDEF)-like protein
MDFDKRTDQRREKGQESARILVVDDEKGVRDIVQEAIRTAGYTCWTSASGDEALRILEEKRVDLIIADIKLPGIDGFELTKTVKENYDTDVIIITGYGKDFQYEEAIEKGASEFILKPIRVQELIVRLKRVLRERTLIAQRKKMEEKLRELTITDSLTGLYNMRHFYTQLQQEIDRALRYRNPLSILLLDVDHFKEYNDTLGHLEGDQILIKLGEVIRNCLRTSDTAYRYGGDEFIVLLPQTHGTEARNVAERIRLDFPAKHGGLSKDPGIATTLSIGVVQYQPDENLAAFVKRADQAMYGAKKRGGNRSFLAAG